MPTIFSKIISEEIPCHKVAENNNYLAFLDINPLVMGHVLVIPKKENDYIFNLSDSELSGLMLFAKKVAKAIDNAVDCNRVGVAVIGLEVAHTHIHLVPINNAGDINFEKEKLNPSAKELDAVAHSIAKFI